MRVCVLCPAPAHEWLCNDHLKDWQDSHEHARAARIMVEPEADEGRRKARMGSCMTDFVFRVRKEREVTASLGKP